MISLYPHQVEYLDNIRASLKSGNKSIIAQAETGMGKTVCAAYMVASSLEKGTVPVYFTVHRKQLLAQTTNTFKEFGIDHSFIAAGQGYKEGKPCYICSIDTLKNRHHKLPVPKIIFVDEAHLSLAPGYLSVLRCYKSKGAFIIGLTASPRRLSGEAMSDLYDDLVLGPKTSWLMDEGYLSKYRLFAPSVPDLKGIAKSMGDYSPRALEEIMKGKAIVGEIVENYIEKANGKRCIGFACTVSHSKGMASIFSAAGIIAAHIDGNTPDKDRKKIIESFADGDVKILFNVEIMCEGFDLSSQVGREVPVEGVIQLRSTASLALHRQQVGRALRRKDEPAIILDHAGNALRHGFPDDHIEWSLDGNKRDFSAKVEKDTSPLRICKKCFLAFKPKTECPSCGEPWVNQEREPDLVKAELKEIEKKDRQREQAKQQGQARTYDSLVALGKQRGYKHPHAWAKNILIARGKYA